ncbi:MAG: hypothetical protein OEL87_02295 [Nanoarchaeota archaeon]|nr:hypothetical protein [Nanoarchaeota archaeon]
MKDITAFAITFVGGLIPETLLSYFVMKLSGEGWSVFWLTYFAIQAFYLIVWFFRSIVNWVLYRIFWKKSLVKGIYESLIGSRYPNEGYYLSSSGDVETFFEDITYEPQLSVETRIHAASLCTRFNVLHELGNIQGMYRLRKVAFEALSKYFNGKDCRINPQHIVDFNSIETAEDIVNAMK